MIRHDFTFTEPIASVEANQGSNTNRDTDKLEYHPKCEVRFLSEKTHEKY